MDYHSQLLSAIKASYDKKRLAVLCGAGVSLASPSCLPVANTLKRAIFSGLASSIPSLEGVPTESVLKVGLENLVGIVSRYGPGFAHAFQRLFERADRFNWNHRSVREIAYRSRMCATTNFDLLFERAGGPGEDPVVLASQSDLLAISSEHARGRTVIAKLHGSADSSYAEGLGVTLEAIAASLGGEGTRAAAEFLSSFDLLVLGYRGRDPDVAIPLSRGRGRLFWCWHDSERHLSEPSVTQDNSVAAALCANKDAFQFRCDTRAFLVSVVAELGLKPNDKYPAELSDQDIASEVTSIVAGMPDSQRLLSLIEVLNECGEPDALNQVVTEARNRLRGRDRVNAILLWSNGMKRANPELAKSLIASFGNLNDILKIEIENTLVKMHVAWLRAFFYTYDGDRTRSEQICREALATLAKLKPRRPGEIGSASLLKRRFLIELGNSLCYRSLLPGDRWAEPLLEAVSTWIDAAFLALDASDLSLLQKLLENIASYMAKCVYCSLSQNPTEDSFALAMSCRSLSNYFLEFIGNQDAVGVTQINISFDNCKTGQFGEAARLAGQRLEKALILRDYYGIAISLECIGDALLGMGQRKVANVLYDAAISAHSACMTIPDAEISNIAYKKEHGLEVFSNLDVNLLHGTMPTLSSVMNALKNWQVTNGFEPKVPSSGQAAEQAVARAEINPNRRDKTKSL